MNSSELIKIGFTKVTKTDDRDVSGGYAGDMLSWVMGRAKAGEVWFTIVSNINTIAVASLVEVSAIVICDSVTLDETVIKRATEEGINVYYTNLSVYNAAVRFNELFTGNE